jgi:hypothetical protein
MIYGRPALIVIQMQRGEKAVMFRQMAKHGAFMFRSSGLHMCCEPTAKYPYVPGLITG